MDDFDDAPDDDLREITQLLKELAVYVAGICVKLDQNEERFASILDRLEWLQKGLYGDKAGLSLPSRVAALEKDVDALAEQRKVRKAGGWWRVVARFLGWK